MRSLAEAFVTKFEDTSIPEEETDNIIEVYVPKAHPITGSPLIHRLTLDNLQISTIGNVDDKLAESFAKVKEVDLTKNCITDWNEVMKLLDVMPHLEFVNLTMNRLCDETFTGIPATCPQMKTFILNGTDVSWAVIAKLLPSFPSLSELYASINRYKNVELPPDFRHHSLSKLHMNESNICSWQDIYKLGCAFPNMESLTMISTNLESCDGLSDGRVCGAFPKLAVLNVSKCSFTSWEDVDQFRRFPFLSHLRLTGVPFIDALAEKPRRQQLIARLPNLTQLNGSPITQAEREEAERAFIRLFMDVQKPPDRYFELETQYGKLDPLVHVDFTPKTTVSLLVKFEDKSELMEVNVRQTIGEFKKLLKNFTGLPANKFSLLYMEIMGACHCDVKELRIPDKMLSSLRMNDGDEIHINRK